MSVLSQFEALRKKLIDTSMRNRMLNFNLSRASGVVIEGEDADQIFQTLVIDLKKMSFIGQPESNATAQSPFLDELLREETESDQIPPPPPIDRTDTKLNTPHRTTILARRLLKTYRDAQELYEETGVNILFLALGALKYKQSDQEEKERLAPLLFLPVRLIRDAHGRYKVEYNGEDLGDNLSLRVKLKDEFGIELPKWQEEQPPTQYADEVSKAIRLQKGWEVDPNFAALGFFQFSKIVMYHDLEPSKWEQSQSPIEDEDIVALLSEGYQGGDQTYSDDQPVDPLRPPDQIAEIFSADSSQTLAILRALTGQSMVIEGPPGTGKSQTISNLIAEFVAQGKKILFVSEKMAALEVVFRKLDQAGIGDACLELHSRSSRRREFYEELKRIMSLRGELAGQQAELNRLATVREQLNAYCQAVNEPVEPWGLSPHQAIGLASRLPAETDEDIPHRIPFQDLKTLTQEKFKEHLPLIASYQNLLRSIGTPKDHPFFGCGIRVVTPGQNLEISSGLQTAVTELQSATERAAKLAKTLFLQPIQKPSDIQVLHACVKRAVEAPPYDGVAVKLDSWRAHETAIRECITHLQNKQSIREKRRSAVHETIWDADLGLIVQTLDVWVTKWFKFLSGEYKLRLKELQNYLQNPNIASTEALLIAKEIQSAQVSKRFIRENSAVMANLFGAQWQGETTDPKVIARILDWCLELRSAVEQGAVPQGLLDFFQAAHTNIGLAEEAQNAARLMDQALQSIRSVSQRIQFPERDLENENLAHITQRVQNWHQNLSRLNEVAQLNIAVEKLQESGLNSVADLGLVWDKAPTHLRDGVERAYYEGILLEAVNTRLPLQGLNRHDHEEIIRQFHNLDDLLLRYNRSKVRHAHIRSLPDWSMAAGNLGQVKRQCELRRGHRSIRWAIENAGAAIQQMKPVFLMSPLSVAQYLPRETNMFDVVIFDEASQIKPEDALSAIVRAGQTVVVGDSKQMPPTAFFDKLVGDDDDQEEDEVQIVGQMESLLALMAAACGSNRSTDLRWHYRNLHPALIRPSNAAFYNHRLVVFPSPVLVGADGLKFHYSSQDVYDRGKTRKNMAQAARVAQAVITHFKSRPHESLIVVAFSKQQEEAIEDALELEFHREPTLLASFNSRHPFERFDVKNLESVQGDERDVVYISVGYGPDERGYTAMSFGPINTDGGDRRLNVLMSRARRRCEVFSSLKSSDMRVGENPQSGVILLKKFLQFAETGELDDPLPQAREEESIFEIQVAQALRGLGYEVDAQVGSIGFYIDLAVRHPDHPGAYVLGVECDGASYHSAKSARDRDKLRQAALEDRGWKLHRIWSTDWWQNPAAETARCKAAIDAAIQSYGSPEDLELFEDDQSLSVPPTHFIVDIPPVITPPTTVPYSVWDKPFDLRGYTIQNLPPDAMARCITAILEHEGPLHLDVLINRIRKAANLGRAGSIVRTSILQGLELGMNRNQIQVRDGFVYPPNWVCTAIRNVADLPASHKKPEWVTPEEIAFALQHVVKLSYGISETEALNAAWKTIGFTQTTSNMTALTLPILEVMVMDQKVIRDAKGELHSGE